MKRFARYLAAVLIAGSTTIPGMALLSGSAEVLACGATECAAGTGCWSQNGCHAGQRCKMDGNTPTWIDDESCPPGGED